MATNYIQEGKALNYTADEDIASGQFVLMGAIGGVAKNRHCRWQSGRGAY
jgi:predicted RecA/RadA family phage recombinase